MDPDLVFVIGVAIFALAFPAVIRSFSTSGASLKPAIVCVVVGGSLILLANAQTSREGYSLTEIPAIVKRLLQ